MSDPESTTITIQHNAKLIDILCDIQNEIGNFTVTSVSQLENKKIVESSIEDLNRIPAETDPITVSNDSFFRKNMIASLKYPKKLATGSVEKLAGNFLSLFEDESFIACIIKLNKEHKEQADNIIAGYEDLKFEMIERDSNLLDYSKIKNQVRGRIFSELTMDMLIKIGTYCYLKRNCLDKGYNTLLKIENLVIKEYEPAKKDYADSLLLLIVIIKYHIFRLLHTDSKKNTPYYKKVLDAIQNDIKRTDLPPDLEFIKLKHNAYLKILIDGESYNFEKGKELILRHSTKAAMTAIMSRNISHNIGSHVISYWNTELLENLKTVESESGKNYSKEQELIKSSKELFQYIQHRQDFVAELATSIPCSEMSLDLDNDIFGPFRSPNSDKYASGKDSKGDKCISAMLGYIAKSESINMHEKIKFYIDTSITNTRASIPNGLVGVHAVYSILENFIRNAAKHCKRPIENDKEMVKIDVNEIENWKDDYLAVTLWDWRVGSCEKATIESYRKYLPGGKERYFSDTDGNLKSGGWGIKEMLASANFLRKKTPEDLYKYINNPDEYKNEPPLLEAICDAHEKCSSNNSCSRSQHKDNEYKGKFGVRFYLRKPKDLAVISSSRYAVPDANGKFAIKYFKDYDSNSKEISSYMMVLLEKEIENGKFVNNANAPCRIVTATENYNINDKNFLGLYATFIAKNLNNNSQLPSPQYFSSTQLINLNNAAINSNCVTDSKFNSSEEKIVFVYHLNQVETFKAFVHYYENGNDIYIQPVSGGYSTFSKLKPLWHVDNLLVEEIRKQQCLELVESALTDVVIVDERISDWAKKTFIAINAEQKYTNSQIMKKMRVYIIDINTENINYENLITELSNWMKNGGQHGGGNVDELKPARFFVIHQGVLEKLKNNNNDYKLMQSIDCRWLVIDSGRGVPEKEKLDLYPNARFVQISALQKLLENFDKHGLVQTLFATRRPVN